ncbi:MAG: hypothetical protein UT33_C0009G0104 [Candidatus Peregrinibacteria bacterium GW2011_GWC2_39_14]|nr:MAG: hypothetical protein US92_C0005G0104 [Candidatus Peregrinibacteria bacterium GW2011_GWA2_38_36]KKR06653.1 MAG: hypothetical protein UT33_C0009G0104 [Candidatus Peregrinibacteria bacterium GW2011_GWC2_39_14]
MVAGPRLISAPGEADEAAESNEILTQLGGKIAGLKAKQDMQAVAAEIAENFKKDGTNIRDVKRIMEGSSSDRRVRDQLTQAVFINYFKNLDIRFMVRSEEAQMISRIDVMHNLDGYIKRIQELEKNGAKLTKRTREAAVNAQSQESYREKIVSVAVTRQMQGVVSAEDIVSTNVGKDRDLLWDILVGAAEARKNGVTPIGAIMNKIRGGLMSASKVEI